MTTTLPLFWHLSSASKEERISASVKLIATLQKFQVQFATKEQPPFDDEEDDENSPADPLDALNAQDVSYSMRRLIRGLASPRESSRLGFAVALTELLRSLDTVSCSQIVSLILDATKPQGSMTGQEERDVLFARLFGFTAIVQSGLLVRTKPLPTSASSATLASTLLSYQEVVNQLLELGEAKSWIRESVWWTLCLAIDALRDSDAEWKDEAIQFTIGKIIEQSWSPEKVALTLKLQELCPDYEWKSHLSPVFKKSTILHTNNLHSLAKILKESAPDVSGNADVPNAAPGSWKPQLHFVWDVLLDELLPGPNSGKTPKGSFPDFFRIVIDESLFASTSSQERKFWGFQVFQKALPRVTETTVPMLFTKNFMRTWINHLSKRDRYLHKMALQTATAIQSLVEKNPRLGFALILQLTGVHGSQEFDKLTKTKTVETILKSMDANGISSYVDYLLSQVDSSAATDSADLKAIESRRSWVIDQLATLIKNGAIPKDDSWIQTILGWLVVNGLFTVKKKSEKSSFSGLHSIPTPPFTDDLCKQCRIQLLSCLADLTNLKTVVSTDDSKTLKVSAVAADGEFWVAKVLKMVEQLEKKTKNVAFISEEYDEDLLTQAKELVQSLDKVSEDQKSTATGVQLLLLSTLIQLYCNPEEESVKQAVEACIEGGTRMFSKDKAAAKNPKSSDATEEDAAPIDILVDIIIGLLEQSTVYMRTVANHAFGLLARSVQESTVNHILAQLERRDPTEPEDELMELDDDDDDAEDEEKDEDSDDSASEQDEDEEEEAEDSNDEDVDIELRNKIAIALQASGPDAGSGDEESEDEDLMDDDQMLAIDEQLAEVFRSRVNEKKSGKDLDAYREASHFKNRVLDLVDIFIRKQPSSPLVVRFILPLVDIIARSSTDEKQLSDKAQGIIKSRIAKGKDIPSDVDVQQATSILNDLHNQARRIHSSQVLGTFSQCSLNLSKVLLLSGGEEGVLRIYRGSLGDFVTRKKSTFTTAFFLDFLRRYPKLAWILRDDLIELSARAINVYRQCQVFQLLQVLVNQLPVVGADQEEVTKFIKSLEKTLLNVLSDACAEKLVMTPAQAKDLCKLGLIMVRETKRVGDASSSLDSSAWKTLGDGFAASARFQASPALQKMCEQIAHTPVKPTKKKKSESSSKDSPAGSKRKAKEIGDDDGTVEPKVSKRKKVKG